MIISDNPTKCYIRKKGQRFNDMTIIIDKTKGKRRKRKTKTDRKKERMIKKKKGRKRFQTTDVAPFSLDSAKTEDAAA